MVMEKIKVFNAQSASVKGTDRDKSTIHNSTHSENWEQLFDSIQSPILIVTPDGIIIEANDATLQAARKKRDEVIGKGICRIVHGGKWPHIKCPLEEFLKICSPKVEDTRLPGLFGEYSCTILPVKNAGGHGDKIMIIARELSSAESQRVDSIQTAKMAAIGELAAGVAHEINNPITGIINFAQILLDSQVLDDTYTKIVQNILKEGDRVAAITHNLLSFARADGSILEPVNPVDIVKDSLMLGQHQLKKDGITVITDFPEKDLLLVADFRRLQQVILNLISNSRYALNARYQGYDPEKKIEISCGVTQNEGNSVYRISVKDHGTGMPQSLLQRIFEPFFTSKPPGEGTGLGLSISYGIIKDHKGVFRVNSILHKFTEMIIELPMGT
jgi:nitrogen-specific signal transduction histidine kinase